MSVSNCPSIQPSPEKILHVGEWLDKRMSDRVSEGVTECDKLWVWRSERVIDWKVEGKMLFYKYRNSHYKDKPISQPSYPYDGNTYTWKDGLYIEIDQMMSKRWGGHYITWSPQQNFFTDKMASLYWNDLWIFKTI